MRHRPADAPITEDNGFLAAARQHASPPTLMMSLVHLTGDASLLRGRIRPAPDREGMTHWDENAQGRVLTMSPWLLVEYWGWTQAPNLDDFVMR